MGREDQELDYYRAVEDFFATMRGVPHTLSPRDFEMLRGWWREEIPLAAVTAGIAEVFARRRDRGEPQAVVSLRYCRHAVAAHARQIAEMQVGSDDQAADPTLVDTDQTLHQLADTLRRVASGQSPTNQRLADVITGIAASVESAGELPPAAIEEHLFALESALLSGCLTTLDTDSRERIERHAQASAESSAATPEARDRALKAHRDRQVRQLLELPRLEL